MIPEPQVFLTKSQNGQGTDRGGTLRVTGYVFVKFDENLIESRICCIAQFYLTKYIAVHIKSVRIPPVPDLMSEPPQRETKPCLTNLKISRN